jgi:phosphatidylglycerophosphatase A
VFFAIGVWLCHGTARDLGLADHPGIVWDEIVGYLITMTAAPAGWTWIVLGFVLFRLFDIWKPWPISWLDRNIKGGLGIMLDDALAGTYACLVLQLIAWGQLG